MKTKTASIIIGIIFLAVGLLGFTSNPLIGMADGALFHADTTHSIVHIVSGLLFVLVALAFPAYAPLVLKIFGAVYFLLGVLGMFNIGSEGTTQLLCFLNVNGPDNYLHIGLGLLIFLAGFLKPNPNVIT